ncbi:DUF2924 domain-containing protein [Bosea sp. (in: a-proteobacteria)]|uniref:DUF2924 domain-containing protein n=1 Tax=Bosea sp. (in: a-proteobacteria) TaxID=1871050 RepID=UPI0026201743|nr:DUF2924 domain-containing protein [Bosea sp. (in: a-proteobacteria)]MCO5091731.1 DUF2924 domain-containing protein [Bosea sp. (in: a-proteobacteria)]
MTATRLPDTLPDNVSAQLAALTSSDLHQLRVQWRKLMRNEAPAHLTRSLLLRILAYKVQELAYGGLDRESVRYLDRIAERLAAGDPNPVPPVPDPRRGRLRPGTLLEREHGGTLHRVSVIEAGFSWQGRTYQSLSEVARAITGTNWNGPRFFGLRDKDSPARKGPRRVPSASDGDRGSVGAEAGL